jgi:hypothetical protein
MKMIQCLPELTKDSDLPFWISRTSFYKHFDQEDFLQRDAQDVDPSYLDDWFNTDIDGTKYFILPTVQFISDETQFINGRHRTAVLLSYLDEIPLAFEVSSFWDRERQDEKKLQLLHEMTPRPINMCEHINLPDLSIKQRLP